MISTVHQKSSVAGGQHNALCLSRFLSGKEVFGKGLFTLKDAFQSRGNQRVTLAEQPYCDFS
jgi:hypothetical protein